jgi:DDE_Tnp_1-associated
MQKFRKAFRQLPDPRAGNARHDLLEVLFIALAAIGCGAGSCAEEFGRSKAGLLQLFLGLEHGIPSHDTFSRVFRLLKPEAFELAFRRFMAAFAKANGLKLTGVVAVDGKALRGAYERGGRATPLHQRLCGGSPHGFGAAEGAGAQRDGGRHGGAQSSLPRRLHRYRRCAALPPRLCRGGARAGRPLCAGDQGQPRPLVHGGYAAVCAIGQAQQRPADRPLRPRP